MQQGADRWTLHRSALRCCSCTSCPGLSQLFSSCCQRRPGICSTCRSVAYPAVRSGNPPACWLRLVLQKFTCRCNSIPTLHASCAGAAGRSRACAAAVLQSMHCLQRCLPCPAIKFARCMHIVACAGIPTRGAQAQFCQDVPAAAGGEAEAGSRLAAGGGAV